MPALAGKRPVDSLECWRAGKGAERPAIALATPLVRFLLRLRRLRTIYLSGLRRRSGDLLSKSFFAGVAEQY
jgi:hypothetical protein